MAWRSGGVRAPFGLDATSVAGPCGRRAAAPRRAGPHRSPVSPIPLPFAIVAGLVALAGACDVCPTPTPPISAPVANVVASGTDAGGCDCQWFFRYSNGATLGRATVTFSSSSGEVSLSSFSDAGATSPIALFPQAPPLDAFAIHSTSGAIAITLSVPRGADIAVDLTIDMTAINSGPEITLRDDIGYGVGDFTFNNIRVEWGTTQPLPFLVVDYDNFDQGLSAEVELTLPPDSAPSLSHSLILPPPLDPSITLVAGAVGDFVPRLVLDGPGSAVEDALRAVRIVPRIMREAIDEITIRVSDNGNSGEGGALSATHTELLMPACRGHADLFPGDSLTDGHDMVPHDFVCTFHVHDVEKLIFVDLFMEATTNPDAPCNDYLRVYDGPSKEAGELISLDLAPTGEICGLGTLFPSYESITGSLFVEAFTNSDVLSFGYVAEFSAVPQVGEFVVRLVDSHAPLSALPGTDMNLPRIAVSGLPDGASHVRASVVASLGTVYVRDPDSFLDVIVAEGNELILEIDDPVKNPLLRVGKALQELGFRAPTGSAAVATIVVSVQSGTDEAQSLELPVFIDESAVNTPEVLRVHAFQPTAVPISVPTGGAYTESIFTVELATASEEGLITLDPRAPDFIEAGYVRTLSVTGSPDQVNAELAHLVYRTTGGTSDVLTVRSGVVTQSVVIDVNPECTGNVVIYGFEGLITDRAGDPSDIYSWDLLCTWDILGSTVLTFPRYDIGQGGDFAVDDGRGQLFKNLLGLREPGRLTSRTSSFHVTFNPLHSTGSGFHAAYSLPAGANPPPLVVVPATAQRTVPGARIRLGSVTVLDDKADGIVSVTVSTSLGSLVVIDTLETGSILTFSGTSAEADTWLTRIRVDIVSDIGTTVVSITAEDAEGNAASADLIVEAIQCTGLVEIFADTATISDGSGSGRYGSLLECGWLVQGARAPAELVFSTFDVESATPCPDWVRIYDGTNSNGRFLGEFCSLSAVRAASLISLSGSFFVSFFTNSVNEGDGFEALYGPLDATSTTPLGLAPTFHSPERIHSAVALVGTSALVVGGELPVTGERVLSPLSVIPGQSWKVLESATPAAPAPRSGALAVGISDRAFVLLGGEALNDVWLGDIVAETVSWTQGPESVPEPVVGATGYVLVDGYVHILTGSASVLVLDLSDLSWDPTVGRAQARQATAPPARTRHATAPDSAHGRLFMFGGVTEAGTALDDAWMYTVDQDEWAALDPGPSPCIGCVGMMIGDEFGVLWPDGGVVAYNVTMRAWTVVALGNEDEAVADADAAAAPDAESSEVMISGISGTLGGRPAAFVFADGAMSVVSFGLEIHSLSPRVSPRSGGTVVTASGFRFETCVEARCLFGDGSSSPAVILSGRRAVCTSPSGSDSSFRLSCTDDGTYESPVSFFVFDGPVIESVTPTVAVPGEPLVLQLGGVDAEVLDVAEPARCMVGDAEVAGERSGAQVTCLIPDDVTRGSTLELRVSIDGQQYAGDAFEVEVESADSGSLPVLIISISVASAVVIALVAFVAWRQSQSRVMRIEPAKWLIPFSELVLEDEIGRGGCGVVYVGRFRDTRVAIKTMRKVELNASAVAQFRIECEVMSELRHPNIVLFMGGSLDPPDMAIVLEFMPHGSLFDLISNEDVNYGTAEAFQMTTDIVRGMAFLHGSDPPVLHRDLKSLNVLVDKNWTMKVSDFGLTVFDGAEVKGDQLGSVQWAAPEVLRGETFTRAADVYAFGVTLWEIVTRRIPYWGRPIEVVLGLVANQEREPPFRPETKRLGAMGPILEQMVLDCWENNPDDRPSFQQVFARLDSGTHDSAYQSHSILSGSHTMTNWSQGEKSVAPPSGRVCLCVIGVEAAAELWQFNPVFMRNALHIFHEAKASLLMNSDAYVASNGREITVAAFSDVQSAVVFATRLQFTLLEANWPEDVWLHRSVVEVTEGETRLFRGLRATVAVHSGYPETAKDPLSKRVSYEGPVVNDAFALWQGCNGGQILISQEVHAELDPQGMEVIPVHSATEPDSFLVYPLALQARHKIILEALEEERAGAGTAAAPARQSTEPPWMIAEGDVELGDVIGQGMNGTVYKASWLGTDVAAKTVSVKAMRQTDNIELQMEAGLAAGLRHPNVCQFLGAVQTKKQLYVILELVSRGSLYEAYLETSIPIGDKTKVSIARDIALGMAYLHSQKPAILHRDLKSKNVLVDESWAAKITDFGLARTKSENTMTRCGTGAYLAPEVARGERYGEPADVYSFAIVLWEILERRVAFTDWLKKQGRGAMPRLIAAVAKGRRPKIDANRGGEAMIDTVRLLEQCWHQSVEQRPSFQEIQGQLAGILGKM